MRHKEKERKKKRQLDMCKAQLVHYNLQFVSSLEIKFFICLKPIN